MFRPRDRSWRDIGEESAMEGIGINMVLAPSKFIDIGSIGMLPLYETKKYGPTWCAGVAASISGGEIFFHPRFSPARDEMMLTSQLQRLMRRTQGYNCVMRIRCSTGYISSSFSSKLCVDFWT
jgi:protein transport protein SEC24